MNETDHEAIQRCPRCGRPREQPADLGAFRVGHDAILCGACGHSELYIEFQARLAAGALQAKVYHHVAMGGSRAANHKRALDKALADTARAAEEALAEGEPLGLWLLPLDDHLAPRGTLRFPADEIPPSPAERRWLMECLVPGPLAGAAGYIVLGEGLNHSGNSGGAANRADVVFMHAETRAGDARVRFYPIIWSDAAAPRLASPREVPAEDGRTFSRLLQVADAFQGCVDDTLLECALAAHADVIETLADGDILMFAVGEQNQRRQLAAETAAGDRLAIEVLAAFMIVTCPNCGGDRWRPDGPDGERCVDCGAWSPCSRPHDAGGTEAR